jgi:transposase
MRPLRTIIDTNDSAQSAPLAGIDLVAGQVHALVKDRHRSREFIEFLKLLDAAYPARTAIKLILDNRSAHISNETKAWLAQQPAGRFEFSFTPKHGSWLSLVEGFFSKLARSVLRHIRVAPASSSIWFCTRMARSDAPRGHRQQGLALVPRLAGTPAPP